MRAGVLVYVRAALLPCMLIAMLGMAQSALAEAYVAGFAGMAFPSDLSGIEGVSSNSGSNAGAKMSDLALGSGPVFGGKIGYFLPDLSWVGVEVEGYQAQMDIEPQTVVVTKSGSTTPATLGGEPFRMTTVAFNVLARYPHERFQPYAGIGVGLFWPSTTERTSFGLNVQAGLRVFFAESAAVFAEWKFNHAPVDLADPTDPSLLFTGDYNANLVVGGVSWHF